MLGGRPGPQHPPEYAEGRLGTLSDTSPDIEGSLGRFQIGAFGQSVQILERPIRTADPAKSIQGSANLLIFLLIDFHQFFLRFLLSSFILHLQ